MGISINLSNSFFKWIDNKIERNKRIADYLDEIATEATNLASIWQSIVERLNSADQVDVFDVPLGKTLISKKPDSWLCNTRPLSRLEHFYFSVSKVLGDSNRESIDPIVVHIAKITCQRHLTKDLIEKTLSRQHSIIAYDQTNNIESMRELNNSVLAMHKEAAALHVFAKSFRATA